MDSTDTLGQGRGGLSTKGYSKEGDKYTLDWMNGSKSRSRMRKRMEVETARQS